MYIYIYIYIYIYSNRNYKMSKLSEINCNFMKNFFKINFKMIFKFSGMVFTNSYFRY